MELFSKDDIKKLLWPLILEQVLVMMLGVCDTVMVSSVGQAAVSGVSLVDMLNQLAITIFAALSTGGAVITSQYLGHKNEEKACDSANQLLVVVVTISLAVMLFCLVLNRPMLRLFFGSIDEDVMSSAVTFFSLSALSYPFLASYNAGAALFRSMGNSKITLKISALMNVINVVLNMFFIFVLHLGVAGSALGSLIARAFSAVIIFILLKNPEREIHFVAWKRPLVDLDTVKKILYIGVPNGIENGIFQLGRIVVVAIIAGFGTTQIAANAVANVFDGVGVIPGSAISLAMITIVGQCVGAGDYKQARRYIKKLMSIAYVIFFFLDGLMILTLDYTLRAYSLPSDTLHLAKILITIHAGSAIVLWPLSFVLPNALRASNDVRYTMVVSIFSMFTFRILLSLVLAIHFDMGAIGVFLAMVVDWVFRVTMFLIRYHGDKWQRVKLI